jgi:hypothetical protein
MVLEVEFMLPHGVVDGYGQVHRYGRMRKATIMDEIEPNRHPVVQEYPGYAVVILLARVLTQLGSLPQVTPQVVEGMFAGDVAYLEDLYEQLNSGHTAVVQAICPHCQQQWQAQT